MTEHRHEQTDLDPKYTLYFAVALVVVGIAIYILIWWMFHLFERREAGREGPPIAVPVAIPVPEPRLQISPEGDLEELRRQEQEILSTYRWIDRDKGTARIPIDRAMQLFLERQKK
jgi:hypothetical protein